MTWSLLFQIVFYINVIIAVLVILLDNSSSSEVSAAWMLTLFFLPVVGLFLYVLFGINWKKTRIIKQLPEEMFGEFLSPLIKQQKAMMINTNTESSLASDITKSITLLLENNNSILTKKNNCNLYFSGKDLFSSLLTDLEKAEHSIHMEYFIWQSDELGERIKDILLKKAGEGVQIRLIFDGVGSFRRIKWKYRRELKRNGIEYRYFLDPLVFLSGLKINYCTHRKIVVIDGKTGYTGGMNIGMEYISGGERYPSWRDTHMRIEGEAAHMLQALFLIDWRNSNGEVEFTRDLFPALLETYNNLETQIICSGPDSEWASIKQLIIALISNANKEVLIQSPYFIPDPSLMNALETAALSGIKVHLMMTGIPDKKLPFWAAHTYFDNLIKAGVHIYLYKKGFFHPKVVIIDGAISTLGTCNLDIRSFHINYEVNAVFYERQIALKLKEQFEEDLIYCQVLDREHKYQRNILIRLRNSASRILSPLM